MDHFYVYVKSKNSDIWTVDFFCPDGEWMSESDYDTRKKAAKRVRWLNGGDE